MTVGGGSADVAAPVRGAARELARTALGTDDRVLVTGAGGWFGSTVAALLHGSGAQALYVTRRPRTVRAGDTVVEARRWSPDEIAEFRPTVVVDCAFVLREYAQDLGVERYVYENTVLTQRLLQVAQLPSVRRVISVSSGAAVHPLDGTLADVDRDPYGYLKRQAELALLATVDPERTNVVVARPWSLSGSLIQRPHRYAFADLLLQARSGHVSLRADHEVWRRYVGVDDFFAVCLAVGRETTAIIDSGGELVELATLVERIGDALGVRPAVERAVLSGAADTYYADDAGWVEACSGLGFVPATTEDQIVAVDRFLRAGGVAREAGDEG